jgi:hypothetical protein
MWGAGLRPHSKMPPDDRGAAGTSGWPAQAATPSSVSRMS